MAARTKKMQEAVPSRVVEAPPQVAPPDTETGEAPLPDEVGGPIMSPKLALLAEKIRSDLQGLGDLLQKAVDRKIRLGRHLAEARATCESEGGDWPKFLALFALNERSAREAIQFFKRKDEIEDLRRHGGAALNVSYVRATLAKPRTKVRVGVPSGRTPLVEGESARSGLLSLPSPAAGGGPPEVACEVTAPRGRSTAGGLEGVPAASPLAPSTAPAEESFMDDPLEYITFEECLADMCKDLAAFVEEEFGLLGSKSPRVSVKALEQAVREIRECSRRLDVALQGWRTKGE